MKNIIRFVLMLLGICFIPLVTPVAAHDCPMHDAHMKQMQEKGDLEMGFDHTKTTHHFLLSAKGGSIQVEANDPKDNASLSLIRAHLSKIAEAFQKGDFAKPEAIHAQVPPGVPIMIRLKDAIHYEFLENELGAEVKISTENAEAINAIHEFLHFQIKEHQTGDPM
jgi:hypothetical protein